MPNGMPYERIVPGDAAHSLLPLMALSRDADSGFLPMPPLVSHIPDTDGEAPVSAWINALATRAVRPSGLERVELAVARREDAAVHEDGRREVARAGHRVRPHDHRRPGREVPRVELLAALGPTVQTMMSCVPSLDVIDGEPLPWLLAHHGTLICAVALRLMIARFPLPFLQPDAPGLRRC